MGLREEEVGSQWQHCAPAMRRSLSSDDAPRPLGTDDERLVSQGDPNRVGASHSLYQINGDAGGGLAPSIMIICLFGAREVHLAGERQCCAGPTRS